MADASHAYYCFEVLAASYQQQPHPELESVTALYDQWQKELQETSKGEQDGVIEGETTDLVEERHNAVNGQRQLPSISRLHDSTPSDSSGSTPSSVSVNSSNTQLTSTTSVDELAPTRSSRLSAMESYPMFVTWNTLSRSGHKSLRGCIGTFEALPLERGLETYALTSAFEDTRFSPIPQHQVPKLACSLTLLADFEQCDGPLEWELGKHGIRISFSSRSRKYGATYLPYVATDQGWTKEETLESLMRKAGWESQYRSFNRNSAKPWEELRDFRVVRYTGLNAGATYSEWQDWQRWAKRKKPDLWLR